MDDRSKQGGREYWRSLEERADDPQFREMLQREFPTLAAEWNEGLDRRRFLGVMGASLSLAGLACTRQPTEYIAPYTNQPEAAVLGNAVYYASATTLGGYGCGVLVESHEGRPTKVEGNPDHPASLGGTDPLAQASILTLYDPDRSQTALYRGTIRPWSAFVAAMPAMMESQRALRGAGLRILTGTVTSPTLAAQLDKLLAELPEARWHRYEPSSGDGRREGARRAFGRDVATRYAFDRADVIFSIDADFLGGGPAQARYVRDFVSRRTPGEGMNRLYALECTPTLTGAKADRRLPLRPSALEGVARAVAAGCGLGLRGGDAHGHDSWVHDLVADLQGARGRSIVIAGEEQPAGVHALAHALNEALGNVGRTVFHTEPIEAGDGGNHENSLRDLVAAMNAGRVDTLLILGGNPVYDSPGDVDFAAALERVALRVHLSLYYDETSERCDWHLPQAHDLESWSDVRAFDGSASIVQPLIAPLYDGRSAHEVLSAVTEEPGRKGHDLVRDHWRANLPAGAGEFDRFWRRALHDGVIAGTAAATAAVSLRSDWDRGPSASGGEGLELVVRVDACVHDGRYANNGWLQELPKPLSKLTWDNAALISPKTAESLRVGTRFSSTGGEHGETFCDTLRLTVDGREVTAPVWILPGAADGTITVHLGYGRTRAGRVGDGAGFDAYRLQGTGARWSGPVQAARGETVAALANTQGHWNMEGRDLVRVGTLADYLRDPSLAPHHVHEIPEDMTMYPPHEYDGHAWGMAIDLNSCVGCNACVVACQAENNIPVVGREQVAAGREMHWLRVDRYHTGDPMATESIETVFQPVPCMQCENAPCEVVCPVGATVHSAEGLNDMVYNRCVGTRYCANNCPYKVRRFNFFLYQDWDTESLKLMRNPDVTVRSRGVMEKCTYCVQRINEAKLAAEIDGRPVRDEDLQTACQQACPARAIHFGDLNGPDAEVVARKADPRNYGLLPELNTRPRTTYLGAVRNNGQAASHDEGGHGDEGHHG